MHPQSLESYLPHVQQISRRLESEPGALQELLQTIERFKDLSGNDRSLDEFFKGEYAFYNGHYERALNHYLQAKGMAHFEFFCFRASAYVFKGKGEVDKALKFVKKALGVFPEDHLSQVLFRKLLTPDAPSRLTISGKEIEELAGIFEARPSEEELFASEETPEKPLQKPVECNPPQASFSSADLKTQETFMNADTNLCTYASSMDPTVKAMLTERLYAFSKQSQFVPPQVTADRAKMKDQKDELDIAVQNFNDLQARALTTYVEGWKQRIMVPECCLMIFHGWNEQPGNLPKSSSEGVPFLLSESLRKPSGGFFLRWNGKGIVINPGKHFLQNFHRYGLHINDIDIVISTHDQQETYSDIREIYELNAQLNRGANELHAIQYYLNQSVYQDLSSILKANSKFERRAFHCLELFADSPEIEKLELDPGIVLNYFPIASPVSLSRLRERNGGMSSSLGIRLDLSSPHETDNAHVTLGYISGACWLPFVSHHLAKCDVLLAGIGNTNHREYNKITHSDDSLGYQGACSLLEAVSPKLLLCTEFAGRDGDMRLEMIRKMRSESDQSKQPLAILPAETGLFVDLKSLKIKCSFTGAFVDPTDIRVIKSAGMFTPLHYMSPECVI